MAGLYGSVLGKNYKTLMLACLRHRSTGCLTKNREIFKQRDVIYHTLSRSLTCGYRTRATSNATLSDDARPGLNSKFSNFTSLQTCRQRYCTHCNQTHTTILSHSHRLLSQKSEIFTPILRLHFSQLHGQEGLNAGDIPIVARIKPLSAKEIKPLLKPEEKSKVEETCETLKAKQQAETSKTLLEVMDEALQPKKAEPEPVKKSIVERIVHEVKHYANGFKLLFINIRISLKQFWKVLNGQDLSRREKKLVSTEKDNLKTVMSQDLVFKG